MVDMTRAELSLMKEMIDSVTAELELLMLDQEWFVSDVVDLLASSREIVYGKLGIQQEEDREYE